MGGGDAAFLPLPLSPSHTHCFLVRLLRAQLRPIKGEKLERLLDALVAVSPEDGARTNEILYEQVCCGWGWGVGGLGVGSWRVGELEGWGLGSWGCRWEQVRG